MQLWTSVTAIKNWGRVNDNLFNLDNINLCPKYLQINLRPGTHRLDCLAQAPYLLMIYDDDTWWHNPHISSLSWNVKKKKKKHTQINWWCRVWWHIYWGRSFCFEFNLVSRHPFPLYPMFHVIVKAFRSDLTWIKKLSCVLEFIVKILCRAAAQKCERH